MGRWGGKGEVCEGEGRWVRVKMVFGQALAFCQQRLLLYQPFFMCIPIAQALSSGTTLSSHSHRSLTSAPTVECPMPSYNFASTLSPSHPSILSLYFKKILLGTN